MKPIKSPMHLARVAGLPCAACGATDVQVHHIRKAPLTGAGQKASDWFVMPLCALHHSMVHADRSTFEALFGSQEHLISVTLRKLYETDLAQEYGLLLARNNVLANRVCELEALNA